MRLLIETMLQCLLRQLMLNSLLIQYQIIDYNQRTMLSQRRNNQLDNYISHNQPNRMVSPRNPPLGNLTNNFFSNPTQDHIKFDRNTSSNIQNNTRKPMISPARSPRNMAPTNPAPKLRMKQQETDRTRDYFCSNQSHKNRKAEYIIHIEDEDMYYCGICATQAASQGFTVNKINATPTVFAPNKRQKVIPHFPNYANNKRIQQLTRLMEEIIDAQNQHKKKDPKIVKEHYSQQEKLLNNFYDEQIEIVQKMRRDHLNDLKQQQQRNVQICQEISIGARQYMSDLNQAWDDIQQNITSVVERVQEREYQSAMEAYHYKINNLMRKIDEMDSAIQNVTTYDIKNLKIKIKAFQNKLMELWTDQNLQEQTIRKKIPQKVPKAGTLPTSIRIIQGNTLKNVHQNLPRTINHPNIERQDPFRNLFPEDDEDGGEQRLPEASPQFKAF